MTQEEEEEGNSLLCVACENGQAETTRVLLDHGAIIDHQNKVYTNSDIVDIALAIV